MGVVSKNVEATSDVPLEEAIAQLQNKDLTFTIQLPVSAPYEHVVIKIPERFVLGNSQKNGRFLEFFPKTQSIDDWQELITLISYLKIQVSAQIYMDELIDGLTQNVVKDSLKILDQSSEKTAERERITKIIAYLNPENKKQEGLAIQVQSGPYDVAVIQYAVRPQDGTSILKKEDIEKIKLFLKTNLLDLSAPQPLP